MTVNEDGTVVFSFNGKEWTYGAEESEDNNMGTGKVVTSGSRLNVRTGAGMNYEIIDQLRPGEEVVVVGVGVTGIRSLCLKRTDMFTATIWN